MKSFYGEWSTKYLGNLVISHLINKTVCVCVFIVGLKQGLGRKAVYQRKLF